ncbi:MAG: RsmE family RNA methyltransferase, partial [Gemmataceae bacterium]|nr:RsmE family RNA methyltransferase [Gemmataceae bacterium]
IRAVGRREVVLEIETVAAPQRELPFPLEVAAPLPKGDRGQFLVEKLTELGVTHLVPLRTQRSVVEPGANKLEKLRRWVIEASKQCGRNVLMTVASCTSWTEYALRADDGTASWLAHPGGSRLPAGRGESSCLRCAVGPEGGFTDAEIVLAKEHGWQLLDLGPRTLRIETAALVLAAWAIR